jgi:hypothetical protein
VFWHAVDPPVDSLPLHSTKEKAITAEAQPAKKQKKPQLIRVFLTVKR